MALEALDRRGVQAPRCTPKFRYLQSTAYLLQLPRCCPSRHHGAQPVMPPFSSPAACTSVVGPELFPQVPFSLGRTFFLRPLPAPWNAPSQRRYTTTMGRDCSPREKIAGDIQTQKRITLHSFPLAVIGDTGVKAIQGNSQLPSAEELVRVSKVTCCTWLYSPGSNGSCSLSTHRNQPH